MKSLFKIFLFVIAAMLIFSQSAVAEGASSYDWTGWYGGAHFGYGWGQVNMGLMPILYGVPQPVNGRNLPLGLANRHPGSNGFLGGAQVGCNLQKDRFVFGLEADISGSGMDGSDNALNVRYGGGRVFGTSQAEFDWFGTLRPRVGYTLTPRLLLYVTGGLAYGHVNYSANLGAPPRYQAFSSKTQAGWSLGAGLEYAVGKRWSVKAEYLHCDLGDTSIIGRPAPYITPYQVRYDFSTAADLVDCGLNYHF